MKKNVVVLVLFFMFFPLLIACNGARLQQTSPAIPTPISAIQQPTTEAVSPTVDPNIQPIDPTVAPVDPTVQPINPTAEPDITAPVTGETSPLLPIDELGPFTDALITAVYYHDYATMTDFMSSTFTIGHYGSEGLALTRAEADTQLQINYAPPSTNLQFPAVDHASITDMLGLDPLTAFGPDANLVRAVYSQGWGQSGDGDAVLVIAERPDGNHFWYGMIYTHTSFVTQQPEPNAPTRISFENGATSTSINSLITEPIGDEYLLWASAGQLMTVKLESPNNDVRLSLYGLDDGQPLSRADTGATYWRGILQASQDYAIRAVHSGANSNYTLTVDVQPVPEATGAVTLPLQFAPGATGTAVSGMLASGFTEPHRYQVTARAGQFLSVAVRSIRSADQPVVTVFGETWGFVSPDGIGTNQQDWVGQLPQDGVYEIVVHASGSNVDYILDVQIIDGPIEPIQFQAGTTGTSISGYVEPFKPAVYVVNAAAGQRMTALLDSPTGTANINVEMADRSLYLGYQSMDSARGWEGILPTSDAYYLFVTSDVPQIFSLRVDIITYPVPKVSGDCPLPDTNQTQFATLNHPFCFLYPAGLGTELIYGHGGVESGVILSTPPRNAGIEPTSVSVGIYETGAANDRSLPELAQALLDEYGGAGSFEEITLGGQSAMLVESPDSPIPLKQIVFVHNDDRVYRLVFARFNMNMPAPLPTADQLLDMVVNSFVFHE